VSDSLCAETIQIAGHSGDQIEAYLARPSDNRPRGGVVVIHHMPGYDRSTKEITRRSRARLRRDLPKPVLARGAQRRP
jgi:carboxymethylenebutenolidase